MAFRPEISGPILSGLAMALTGRTTSAAVTTLSNTIQGSQPWRFNEDGTQEILNRLELHFPLLEAEECKVGIGVATGADNVFIGTETELNVEPERRLPLVMTRDIRNGSVDWGGRWVLNPFEDDGRLVDLDRYPRFSAYLNTHRAAVLGRNVAGRNPTGWYRTIDRIHSTLTHRAKLLSPDIKGDAHVVYEPGQFYPHHNLYFVVSDTWDLHALRAILSSRVARAFVSTYCPKMRGGFLRFQAQYLRRIRLPRWDHLDKETRGDLIRQGRSDSTEQSDDPVRRAYGLNKQDWDALSTKKA